MRSIELHRIGLLAFAIGTMDMAWGQCGSTVYDSGGAGGNYGLNENLTWTYCAPPGQVVTITFTSFSVENGYDFLSIHDGSTNGAPQIGIYTGNTLPPSYTGTVPGGCITLWFTSDFSITYPGWVATISCSSPPPPPAGDCVYQLSMFDSYGDGWDGSTVGISINGGAFTNYTVTAAYNTALIGVNIGDIIVVQYTAAGIWQNEISYTLGFWGGNAVFNSGSPPGTGIVFTQTVDCVPPPAPPEDCVGAITVCNGQSFNNNTNNTGNNIDLTSANYGCLASAERQGTWYTFSPSSGGNIAFTISPSNAADDYDFAIWGPFPPGSNTAAICPPPSQPIRCSYSYLSGNTGLNYTATDNTEGVLGDKWVNDLTVTAGQVYLLYISNYSQSGLAFDLNWNLTNGASLDCTVLPVELLDLHAEAAVDHVRLYWTTATELNTERFEIERSPNGLDFTQIGELPAAGHSLSTVAYEFPDLLPGSGMNYYRLKQVDQDGHFVRSDMVWADFQGGTNVGRPYPNPTIGWTFLPVDMPRAGVLTYQVHDAVGRTIRQGNEERPSGRSILSMDLEVLPEGVYTIVLFPSDDHPPATYPIFKR